MPIKYPDFLQHNNPDEVLIDATENQTKGFGFFDTTGDRDSLNSNLHTDGYLAMVGTTSIKAYIFQGGTWTDSSNWVEVGGSGLDNVVEDTSPQLGGALDTNDKNIEFGDSSSSSVNRLTFGDSGQDLQIYHGGGTINHIVGLSTHSTYITGGADLYLRAVNGEEGVTINGDGSVELFYDNVKKFETTTGGVKVDGTVEFKRFSTAPTAFVGGMYADDQNNLYFGIDETL